MRKPKNPFVQPLRDPNGVFNKRIVETKVEKEKRKRKKIRKEDYGTSGTE